MIQFEIVSPSKPIMRAIIENMILPDHVLCYIPQVLETFGEKLKSLEFWGENFENFGKGGKL